MSKTFTKKLTGLFATMCAACLMFGFSFSENVRPVSAETETDGESENVLYKQDFSGELEGDLAEHMTVSDGAATITDEDLFMLPVTDFAESNNYVVEFDLKLDGSSSFYLHLVGLNGTNPEAPDNIYLGIEGNGAYILVSDNSGNRVYNNSTIASGGIDATAVDLSGFAKFQLVHYEGYLEVWVNGTRRCVTHLSNFGNNMYQTRAPLKEGKITGFGIDVDNANAFTIDNISIYEATPFNTSATYTNDSESVSSSRTFDLSARNLYHDNFKVEGTFSLADTEKTGYYPTIKLYGMNASLLSTSGKEYSLNIQSRVDNAVFNPEICWQPEGETQWGNQAGEAVTFEQGDRIEYRVEVYGDNVDYYLGGNLAISTTFEEMGIEKGHLQYITIMSGNGGVYWTDFSYTGFENEVAAEVSASDTTVMAGSSVTFNADLFGSAEGDFSWYVNGEKQSEESMTLVLSDLAAGTYTVQYKSDTIASEEVVVTVVDKMVTISSEKTEIYPTEEITVTAVLQGDFEGETFAWYLNGEKQEQTGTSATFASLAAGTYTVQYKSESSASNEFVFTVLESKLEVTTEKNSYENGEKATFTAEMTGLSETEEIFWYVDGVKQEGVSGETFELDMGAYATGDKVIVYAETSSGVRSNEVTVSVSFDVMKEIQDNEYYKTIYEDKIEEGGTYGNFSVGKDENGELYLYSAVENAGTSYVLNAKMPSNVNYMLEYDLYIPADVSSTSYIYPCLTGLNSQYPAGLVELAWEVNEEGVRPYVKDQSTNKEYLHTDYGCGLDLTYEGGIAKKGDWNKISVAVSGKYIAMYINGEMALFFQMPTATVPSGCSFNLYPDGGAGVVPVRIRNISFSGVVEPAPDLVSVNVSLSSVNVKAGETVTATATLNPFNAEANEIAWYVNGEKMEGNELSYRFSSDTPWEYKIYCEIDCVKSAEKTITVTAADGGEDDEGGCGSVSGLGAIAAATAVAFIAVRKKKNK